MDVCPRRLSSVVFLFRRCRHCHGRLSLSCSCVASALGRPATAGLPVAHCRVLSSLIWVAVARCRWLSSSFGHCRLCHSPLGHCRALSFFFRPPFPALSSLWPTLVTIPFSGYEVEGGRASEASEPRRNLFLTSVAVVVVSKLAPVLCM